MRKWLDTLEQRMTQKPAEQQTRELTNAALAVLEMGDDPKLAESYLDRAYATQEMDTSSRAYGQLHWLVGDTGPIKDFNAIEFNSLPLGAILVGHADALSPEFSKRFQMHVKASLAALRKHEVKPSYTNISLMNATSMLLLGQATADRTVVDEVRKRLDAWINYTRQRHSRIRQPDVLRGRSHRAGQGPEICGKRERPRNVSNYPELFLDRHRGQLFRPAQKLAGPYSRDYDFLTGAGGIDEWLSAAKWSSTNVPLSLPVSDALDPTLYQFPDSIIALAHSGPRSIVSNWDDIPKHLRWVWMGKSVAIGCTSGSYSPQDKLFCAEFAGEARCHKSCWSSIRSMRRMD